MKDKNSRARIIDLIDVLEEGSDEVNPLSIKEITNKLRERRRQEYSLERKAITNDLNMLRDNLLPIEELTVKQGKKLYYFNERLFDIHELRLLVDAVTSARFIGKKETENLIVKLKSLTSTGLAKKLTNNIILADAIKYEVPGVKYYIANIHEAITESKRLKFQYGTYNSSKEFKLHRQGTDTTLEPYALVWSNDFYYLIGKKVDAKEFRHYRVDRMREVRVTGQKYQKLSFNILEHINNSFFMYSGEEKTVEIKFDNHLINVIIDRFGENVVIREGDDNAFIVSFPAKISEGLTRWILTWGSDAEVLYPESLVKTLREESEKLYKLYSD